MNDFKRGMRDGIPIAMGYVPVSFTFGLMAVSVGMTWWQALLISVMNLTSAGQFAGLGYHGREWCLYGNGTDGIYH